MGLQSEPVSYGKRKDPRSHLRACGATEEEIAFLVQTLDRWSQEWTGQRVELNAMTSPQLIAWLEGKLAENGVTKLMPGEESLTRAYRRAIFMARVERAADEAAQAFRDIAIDVPDDLTEQVKGSLDGSDVSWDHVVWQIARAALP